MLESSNEQPVELFSFNRLIRELMTGSCKRSRFEPWEIELLLDVEEQVVFGKAA